jgi:Integrase core domain
MTQGKIERWHQTIKNRVLLENYYLPGELETQIEAFVADYNHLRYHESIANLTPADVYFGRGQTILIETELWPPFCCAHTANACAVPCVPWNFKYGLRLYKRKGIVNQTGAREALAG